MRSGSSPSGRTKIRGTLTRDVVDREGWATARVQRFSLEGVRRLIYGHLRDMGPPPYDVASEVRSRISGRAMQDFR